jgi:hypothetical protein
LATTNDIITAIQSGDGAGVSAMLQEDPQLAAARDANGVSVIMHAFYANQQRIAELLIAAKTDLDEFEAAAVGNVKKLSELLEKNSDIVKAFRQMDLHRCISPRSSIGRKSRCNL